MRVSALARITRENGNGKIKMKRDAYVQNGPFRSSPVPLPFAARFFFKQAPVVRIERGNFFLTPTVYSIHTGALEAI